VLAIAVLIAVIRAKPGDLPQIVKNLTESNVFCLAGWIVAAVVVLVVISAVAVYIRLKPKNNERKK
jgi:molybdopterin biosynthesis enzyme